MHDSGGEAERAGIYTEGWIHTYSMLIIYNYNLQCMELTTQVQANTGWEVSEVSLTSLLDHEQSTITQILS